MNRKQRKRKEKREQTKAREEQLRAAILQPDRTNQAHAENIARENSQPSLNVSRWFRFKQWARKNTFAEVVTVALTGGILTATVFYTVYAARQWGVLKRQADDFEDSQAAQLAVTDITSTITPDPKFTYLITVSYKLCNVGNSAANQVRVQSGMFLTSEVVALPIANKNYVIRPDPGGFTIGPHDCKPFTIQQGMWEIMQSPQYHYWSGGIDYRDIFKRPAHTGWCIYHIPHTNTFLPCERK